MEFWLGAIVGLGAGLFWMYLWMQRYYAHTIAQYKIQAARLEKSLYDEKRYIAYGDQDAKES